MSDSVLRKVVSTPYMLRRDDELWGKDVPLIEKGLHAMIACKSQDYGEKAFAIDEEVFKELYYPHIDDSEIEVARELLIKILS